MKRFYINEELIEWWCDNGNWRRSKSQGYSVVSAHLAWKHVHVMITLNNWYTISLFEGLTGYAEPGVFTALLNLSCSEKPTFIDALSGHLASNVIPRKKFSSMVAKLRSHLELPVTI